MRADGTPETPIERWVLDAGLGRAFVASGYQHDLGTRAQHETFMSSRLDPERNPVSKDLCDYLRLETQLQWRGVDRRCSPSGDADRD